MRDGQKRDFARQLRSAMTDAENRLWRELRRRRMLGQRFRRQVPVGPTSPILSVLKDGW